MSYSNAEYVIMYVNGKLDENKARSLEKDDRFMKAVLLTGKNYRYFERCSKNLKNDPEFLKHLVELYKVNHEFIATMVEEYSNNNPDDDKNIIELNILLDNIYEETEDEILYPAHDYAEGYYLNILESINRDIINAECQEERDAIGFGFIKVDQFLYDSDIVKKFVAKKMLNDIFMNHPNMEFDEIIHYPYHEKENIERMGIRIFLNDILKEYDETLYDYVGVYPELMDKYVKMTERVLECWDQYNEDLNKYKIEQCYEEMNRFIEENGYSSNLVDLFYGIVLKSKERNKILGYLDVDVEEIEPLNASSLSIPERRFVRHMKEYMDEVFRHDIEWFDMEEPIEEEITPGKVLKIDFNKGNKID